MKNRLIFIGLFLIVVCFCLFINKQNNVVMAYTVAQCISLKDKYDDPPAGSGMKWTNWDDFCAGCPGEYCCRKDKTCDCPCETRYCGVDKADGKTKCLLYARSCGCYDLKYTAMVCGKTPLGKISCSYGISFTEQCKTWIQGNNDSGKGCVTDKDCFTCPTATPNYPTSKCDYVKKKCVKSYECGVTDCSSDAQCCGKAGESNPHYECDVNTYRCELVNSCGKNQCDIGDNKTDDWGYRYNPKCQKYTCDQETWRCMFNRGGSFFGKEACTAGCVKGYTCDTTNWKCSVAMGGKYTKESDCTSICKAPEPKYVCDTKTWKCVANSSGIALFSCNKQCVNSEKPSTKYSCNKDDGKCAIDASGKYVDEFSCKLGCIKVVSPPPTTPKYGCNDSKKCVVMLGGKYSSSNCNNECNMAIPPPVIPEACDIREFSVTPPTLGIIGLKTGLKWFTAEWMTNGMCNSCDISVASESNPTSFSLVKSGLGNTGTYDIKDNQTSGLYKYKLTCYGDLDTPERSVNVRIFPFMIWYEVNPVMPSRFNEHLESSEGWK